jgi:alpha-mannosidase
VSEMQQYLNDDEVFFFSSLPRYSAAVQAQVQDRLDTLPRIIGETRHVSLNDYGFSYIANDIISARIRQKAFMVQVESNLERSAEPFAAMAYMLGNEWPGKYLEIAWKQFMKCQPHDTIGGCGVDTIERDVMARLRDTNYIANLISSESLMEVQRKVDTSSFGPDVIILTAYNPCVYPRTEIVDAYVDIPHELGIEDSNGHQVPFAAESTQYFGKVFRDHTDLALKTSTDEFRIKFEATDVPAMGYKTFVLKKGTMTELPTIATDDTTLENEFIKAVVNANGTVTITNKETGEVYEQMNYFQDIGEVGHAWSHVHGITDAGITTQELTAENEVIENSAVQGTIKSTIVFAIPATTPSSEDRVDTDWRQVTRDYTNNLVDLTIVCEYSLKKGAKLLDVTVTFDNRCTNHRLRAMFPTHIHAEKSYAEAPFDVHERYIDRTDKNPYAHFPYLTFPFIRFFGVKDATRHVTVIAHGLKEYEALDDEARSLALTLMRGYENNICTTDEWEYRPGDLSQSIGEHEFTYSIYTGPVMDSYSNLYREADSVSTPVIVSETKAAEGELPLNHSFVSLDNDQIILSGIKKESRGERVVVRAHNASDTVQEAILEFGQDIKAAFYANLNEEVIGELAATGPNKVTFQTGAKKIVTLVIAL